MAKTKFFRVAVEGATVDGRTIDRDMIQQMADTYNPATYTARINCEHLRGFSPQPPFNSYGSIAEVKAEQVEIEIGGKTEKRLALFAAFEVNDQAKEINRAGQKLFSSIEIQPDFAGSKKAYLIGLALTDSPASLGTEVLKFSRDEKRKDNLLAFSEFELEFEEATAATAATEQAAGAFAALKRFFENFGAKPEEPKVDPKPQDPPAQDAGSAFAATFGKQMAEGMEALATAFKASADAQAAAIAAFRTELDAMKADIEKTPARNHSARPQSSGGGERARADC